MSASTAPSRGRGRPPAAPREAVLDAARARYLRGERVDVRSIATELGLSRNTIYTWFGSREELIGEVIASVGVPLLQRCRREARGTGGAALVDTFDRFNRAISAAPALRAFVEQEREVASPRPHLTAGRLPARQRRGHRSTDRGRGRGRYLHPTDRPGAPGLRDRPARRDVPLQRGVAGRARRARPAARYRGRAAAT